jgi:hypothetical protein
MDDEWPAILDDPSDTDDRPFQFGLATLFALVTSCGVMLGLTRSFGLVGFVIAGQLTVAFHVASRTSWIVGVGAIYAFALTSVTVVVATELKYTTEARLLAVGLLGTWASWVGAALHAALLGYKRGRAHFLPAFVSLPLPLFCTHTLFARALNHG